MCIRDRSSVVNSKTQSNWEIEKRCIGVAFAAGIVLLTAGFAINTTYLVAGAILYSGSLIAQAIRDTK